MTLDGLIRGEAEHSDSQKTVSKDRPSDTFFVRMVNDAADRSPALGRARPTQRRAKRACCALWFLLAATAFGSINVRWATAAPSDPERGRRYVSARAYEHALRADVALFQKDWERANDELKLALVYDPTSVYLHTKLIRLALAQGPLTRARKYVRRARFLAAGRNEVLRLDAAVARAEGRLGAAERVLKEALRQDPNDLDAALDLATLTEARGRTRQAMQSLARLARQHPNSGRPLIAEARLLRKEGRWSEAAERLAEAGVREAPDLETARALADCWERLNRLDKARAVWRDYSSRHPGDIESRLAAIPLALAVNDSAAAKRLVRSVERLQPDAPIGRALLAGGEDAAAVGRLARRVARWPGDDRSRFGLGLGLARLKRSNEALGHLGRLPASSVDYVQARLLMVDILIRSGQRQRAELALDAALAAHPQDGALVVRQAELAVMAQQAPAVLPAVRRARRAAPKDVRLWSAELKLVAAARRAGADGARRLLEAAGKVLGRGDFARLSMERAVLTGNAPKAAVLRWVRASPRDVDALLAAFESEVAQGRSGGEWARRALAERPRDPRAIAAMGWSAHREGRHDEAVEHLRRALRLNPWHERTRRRWAAVTGSRGLPRRADGD